MQVQNKYIMINEQQTQMLAGLAQGLSTPPRTPMLRTPADYGMEYEDISFVTEDGITIKGWFIPADSNKVIISNHFSPANRYGFAGHQEPFTYAGGFEVNFLPRYKALHDAGYNVLAYDLRCHGESGPEEDGISGVGYFEWQEVLASIDYIKGNAGTSNMDISLMSMCMGANATMNAMERRPESFEDIKCWIAIAPLKGRTFLERTFETMNIPMVEGERAYDSIYNKISGLRVENHDILQKVKHIKIPTFYLQVRNDMNSRASDVQWMHDHTLVENKKIYFY